MKKRWYIAAVIIIILLLAVAAGCGSDEAEGNVIKVGVAGPMQFVHGEHHWLGAQMAADEINEAGGVQVGEESYQIELVKVDTNELLSVDDAATAIERAINVDNVDFIVGSIRTEAAQAMQEVAMDHQKIFLVCGASHQQMAEKVTEDYDRYKYWFRVTPINANKLVQASLLMLAQVSQEVREEFGIPTPKVAIVVEQAVAGDPLAAAAQQVIPTMGMEVVGLWRPSPQATDLTAELTAIADSGAQIIYTYLSSSAGIPYARQWGELQVPAASVGINVEAQAKGFIEATGGKGNYEYTLNTYAPVEITELTIPFYDKFVELSGQFPTYNAGTYEAVYAYVEAAERAGSLDPDAVVEELEQTQRTSAVGLIAFDETHDVIWGPGYVTALGTQWQDGELVATWPNGWEGIKYPGTVDYKIPPWVIEHWQQ